MKPAFALALLTAAAASALAQDNPDQAKPISVKTVMRNDGSRVVTTTNPDTRTAESLTYIGKETVSQKAVYELDENLRPVSGKVYDGKGRFQFALKITTDYAGRVTEEARFDAKGNPLGKLAYEYDTAGRLRKAHAYDAAGNPVGGSKGRANAKKPKAAKPKQP
jgi:YD repeat-containing protein